MEISSLLETKSIKTFVLIPISSVTKVTSNNIGGLGTMESKINASLMVNLLSSEQ